MQEQRSDLDQRAWHFCYGKIFHPEYTPERIFHECNDQFPGHTLSFESVKEMFEKHKQMLESGAGH